MKRVLSILPQFALPSAIFSLALKDFLAPSYHNCIVCPKYLTEYPYYYVAGAKEGTAEYHPDLPATCIACNATEFAPSCYDAALPISAASESAAGPEVRFSTSFARSPSGLNPHPHPNSQPYNAPSLSLSLSLSFPRPAFFLSL